MCTFDAPILACEACGGYVLRDQTCAPCAAEHECGDRVCPMADYFEIGYASPENLPPPQLAVIVD